MVLRLLLSTMSIGPLFGDGRILSRLSIGPNFSWCALLDLYMSVILDGTILITEISIWRCGSGLDAGGGVGWEPV